MMWKKWIWGLSVAIAGVWGSFGAVAAHADEAHADECQVNYRILAWNSDGSKADYIYKTVKVKQIGEANGLEKLKFMGVAPRLSEVYKQDGRKMVEWIYNSRQNQLKVNVMTFYPRDLKWHTDAVYPSLGGYVLPHPEKGYQVKKVEGNQRVVQENQTVRFIFEVIGSAPVTPNQQPEPDSLPEPLEPKPGVDAGPDSEVGPELVVKPGSESKPGVVTPDPQPGPGLVAPAEPQVPTVPLHPQPAPVVPEQPIGPIESGNQRPLNPDAQPGPPLMTVQPENSVPVGSHPVPQLDVRPSRPRLPHTVFSPTAVTAAATGHASQSKRTRRPARPSMDGTSADSVAHALDWPEVPATDGSWSQHGSRAKHSQSRAQSANRLPQTSEQAPTTWAWGGLLALGSLVGYRYRRLRH